MESKPRAVAVFLWSGPNPQAAGLSRFPFFWVVVEVVVHVKNTGAGRGCLIFCYFLFFFSGWWWWRTSRWPVPGFPSFCVVVVVVVNCSAWVRILGGCECSVMFFCFFYFLVVVVSVVVPAVVVNTQVAGRMGFSFSIFRFNGLWWWWWWWWKLRCHESDMMSTAV